MSRDPGRGCGRPNGGSIRLAPQVGRARRGRSAGLDFEDAIARSVLLDLAAPGAGLVAARLDEALEALQVSLDARRHDADHVADVLDQALGLVLELKHDARLRGRQAMRLSGICSVMRASHSFSLPPTFAFQWRRSSSS